MNKQCHILGITIDTYTLEEVLQQVHRFIDSGRPHQIATVNTEFIMEARRNPEFAACLNQADLKLADGAGIVLAAKLLDEPIPPKISGVDFTQILATEATKQDWPIFLLGGKNGVGVKAARIFQQIHPGLQIAGIYEGDPTDPTIIPLIHNSHPLILLVAWGAPKQDLWIAQHKAELNVPVLMGVGGTFDFLTGKQLRAPLWMRQAGLEWLWRLVREPRRWHRQLVLPQMFLIIFWKLLKKEMG